MPPRSGTPPGQERQAPPEVAFRQGLGVPLAAKPNFTIHASTDALRQCPRFRLLARHLHSLGPRPVAEALLEVAGGADVLTVLEGFRPYSSELMAAVGGCDWPKSPIHAVPVSRDEAA